MDENRKQWLDREQHLANKRKAETDGYYDAWAGHAPDPTLLNDERYEEDYRIGYAEGSL